MVDKNKEIADEEKHPTEFALGTSRRWVEKTLRTSSAHIEGRHKGC